MLTSVKRAGARALLAAYALASIAATSASGFFTSVTLRFHLSTTTWKGEGGGKGSEASGTAATR